MTKFGHHGLELALQLRLVSRVFLQELKKSKVCRFELLVSSLVYIKLAFHNSNRGKKLVQLKDDHLDFIGAISHGRPAEGVGKDTGQVEVDGESRLLARFTFDLSISVEVAPTPRSLGISCLQSRFVQHGR